MEGSEASRAARVSFLAWIFEFRGRPTGGYPRLRVALVFLLRMFWFWIVGARRFLLCRPTGGASLPGSRFLGSNHHGPTSSTHGLHAITCRAAGSCRRTRTAAEKALLRSAFSGKKCHFWLSSTTSERTGFVSDRREH